LRDFVLRELVDRNEDAVPRHTHEEAHFLFVINGLYITSARNVNHLSASRTLIFNPSGTTHRDRFHPKGGRFLTVSLKPETLSCPDGSMNLPDRPLGFSGGEASWLGAKLYREFKSEDEVSPIVMTGLALELVGHTLRSGAKLDGFPPLWLQEARELVHDRFNETMTVSEIAHTVGVHPVYLVRAFRKHYQITIGEYFRKLRVEFACRQLSGTATPLSQVATAAGFYDQSHFTRTFRRLTGMTPTEYRVASRR